MSESVRLSESHLWDELREFYESEGVAAWASDQLPFFATNNPSLARTYVDLAVAFFEDCLSRGLVETAKPVYLVELGGGMGRLAYQMLNRLSQLENRLPVSIRYLLTDYSGSNVEYYRSHERFQPFLESGQLYVQRFDAENDTEFEVDIPNPVFVIANYLFDSLSQDGFRVRDGELFEAACTKKPDGRISLNFEPAGASPYENPTYDKVLADYARELGNTHVPFPIGPLRCLDNLCSMNLPSLAIAMADKALRQKDELLDFVTLPLQRHKQGFSMSVNCHALDQVWEHQGGRVMHSAVRSNPLNIALYSKGLKADEMSRTEHIFRDQIDGFGPLDYLDFRAQIFKGVEKKTLRLCLHLLRLSHWDAELFYELSNTIGEEALTAPLELQKELYDAMIRCWSNFFPIADDRDVPFAVARVLACINQFDQAIGFYSESLRLYGPKALTYHNVAICHFNLGRIKEAREALSQALELEPEYGPSKSLLVRIETEVAKQASFSP